MSLEWRFLFIKCFSKLIIVIKKNRTTYPVLDLGGHDELGDAEDDIPQRSQVVHVDGLDPGRVVFL